MPGYVSHTVMAKDVYNKLKNNVNMDYLILYSLGGDLCKYSRCRLDSHKRYQNEFIDNMAHYIKENKLYNDDKIMGVLYGHICHYIMDDMIHPLVRRIDRLAIKNEHNHTLIELYYNDYLVKERYNLDLKKYLKMIKFNLKMDKNIKDMIDYAYFKTYNTLNVSKYYKFNIMLYKLLNSIFKTININLLYRITGLNRFIKCNQINLINDNNCIKYKNYLGKECNDSLMTLYNQTIDRAIKSIEDVNKYLKN